MKIIFLMPIFTGLTPLISGKKKPVGMPAVYKLLDELKKREFDVSLIGPPVSKDAFGIWKRKNEIESDGVKIHVLPPQTAFIPKIRKGAIGIRFSNLIAILYYFRKIYRIIQKEKPDLIYCSVQLGLIGNIIAKIFKIPSILRYYGTFLGALKDSVSFKNLKFILSHITVYLTFKFKYYSYLIVTNDGTRGNEVSKAFGVPRQKLKFWINGVDKNINYEGFDYQINQLRKELNIDISKKIILTVSRLEYWKRVDRVVRCAPLVKSKIDKANFIIIGDGTEFDSLKRLSKGLKAETYVKFLGFLPHNEISKYMQIADIFVSVYDVSNLCNPILEAMSCGKCVVTLNDGSTDGIIEGGRNGVLIDPQKIDQELPQMIINLLCNDELRTRIGKQARFFAENSLETWEERIDKEIRLLENLAK